MLALSFFIPFLGLINAIKNRKFLSIFFKYLLAFVVNLLSLFILFLLLKWLTNKIDFNYFGKVPFCNRRIERAPCIDGFVFPLCYRCAFYCLGIYLSSLFILLNQPKTNKWLLILSSICIVLCLLDGLFQTFTSYESNNLFRALLGFTAGAGIVYFVYCIVLIIYYKLKKKKSINF